MALATNLSVYYKLENTSDSVGSNTLTNVNSVTFSTGKIGNSADFSGNANSELTLTSSVQPTTISFWTKLNTMTNGVIFASAGETLQGNGSGRILIYDGANRLASSSWVTGSWQHYVFVYTTAGGNGYDIYNNGVFIERLTVGTQISCTRFGRNGANDSLTGMLDEIGIWTRALTADEVSQVFNSGRGNAYPLTDTPSLYGGVAYYKLDESSGNASDSIGSNTLTNTGVTYTPVKINNGSVFNGDTYLAGSTTLIPMGAKSISFWFQSSKTSDFQTIYGNSYFDTSNNGTNCYTQVTDGKMHFQLRVGALTYEVVTSASVCDGTLRLITHTWDGTTGTNGAKVYINGSLDNQATYTVTETNTPSHTFRFGHYAGSAFYTPVFNVDEVFIANRALSSTEITALYNSGNGNQYPFSIGAYVLSCATGVFTLTGNTVNLSKGYVMTALTGVFNLVGNPVTLILVALWNNIAKSVTTWTNSTKNTTTWANTDKNDTTWTNITKS